MILDAFWTMHPARFSSMGRRPLNVADVLDWCAFKNIADVNFRQWLWWLVHRLDAEWLKLADEQDEHRRKTDEFLDKHMDGDFDGEA